MGFTCGIVGLPNVGKSTIFNALTSVGAEAANFPFCTIEPNQGIVSVPDPRLQDIANYIVPKKVVPTTMTFVDIAGLVAGASKGEGLGNKFLAHIRETNAIAHVVRCFDDENVVHVDGSVDPIRDIEIIDTELILADLETVTKRITALEKKTRGGDKDAIKALEVARPVQDALEAGKCVRALGLSEDDALCIRDFHLITQKKVMYIGNVDDGGMEDLANNPHYQRLAAHAASEGAEVTALCGKTEAEIAELDPEEKSEFLADLGLTESGLDRVIHAGYRLLNLQTYFTAGEKEVRAWTIHEGDSAPQAAGVIHTDFERGFIKADVYHYADLMEHKSEAAVKEAGAMRLEGKKYVVQDGDIMHFRFSV
ncbi:MAG: redox-regulated ATPase YchF [Planctomycetota bacterium]